MATDLAEFAHALFPPQPGLSAGSRFLARCRRRYGEQGENILSSLPPGWPDAAALQTLLGVLLTKGYTLADALRMARQAALERIATLDIEGGGSLAQVMGAMTQLAQFALGQALGTAQRELDARFGAPLQANGERCPFWILGMGKLGARELNVSSDIDLIYVYGEEGQSAGGSSGAIANADYFVRLARELQALIGKSSEHGQVFRMDLDLRPNGASGPLAVSLEMLEEYLQVQGREWERLAWLKSRVVAPRDAPSLQAAAALRTIVQPFVFRQYLDYAALEDLRALHDKIRAAAREEERHGIDLKLGEGGIREIEFFAQILQIARGGQDVLLRQRTTLGALTRLQQSGMVSATSAQALAEAYVFLRRLEHRTQYLDDAQTHHLPDDASDREWLAQTMQCANSAEMLAQLAAHRHAAAAEFEQLLRSKSANTNAGAGTEAEATAPDAPNTGALGTHWPEDSRSALHEWLASPRVQALSAASQRRLLGLLEESGHWFAQEPELRAAAPRLLDWLEVLLRRPAYLALLAERKTVLRLLLQLLARSRWMLRTLVRHPAAIDDLANPLWLDERFDAEELARELSLRRAALQRSNHWDDEQALEQLRLVQRGALFRILCRDLMGRLPLESVADDLTALAEQLLLTALAWCWPGLKRAGDFDEDTPLRFGIVAYGKFGGKELGYGSDLDLVFLFDDAREGAAQTYVALARRLITWLTVATASGALYEIDTALRPNGNSGLLVTSLSSFEDYQRQRGSNTAWVWEHQAITRARFIGGTADMRARFESVRADVLQAERDPEALRGEILAMRAKLAQAHGHPAPGLFDLKLGAGGMMDAEFAVQFLVLSASREFPQLLSNSGNIALLKTAEDFGLLPAGVGRAAADAYRTLRRHQHQARLEEQPACLAASAVARESAAILDLSRALRLQAA